MFPHTNVPQDGITFGPTPFCNWVIPSLLLAGGYPGLPTSFSIEQHDSILTALVHAGVTVFVNLQEWGEEKCGSKERREYEQRVKEIYVKETNRSKQEIEVLRFPIQDFSVAENEADLLKFLNDEVVARLMRKRCVYVHCYGGHGRTGIVIASLMGILYSLHADEALAITNALHKNRKFSNGHASPENERQRNQVRSIVAQAKRQNILKKFEIKHCELHSSL